MCLADSTRTRLYANNDKATQNKTASAVYQLDDKNRREKSVRQCRHIQIGKSSHHDRHRDNR